MLFNSHAFLFVFLPLTLVGFYFLSRFSAVWGLAGLLAASLFFYAWWDVRFLALLGGSILVNYGLGRCLSAGLAARTAGRLLLLGIVFNLALLAVFKYANFFVGTVNDLLGTRWTLAHIILPLGISFFTFEQLTFLVDAKRGETRESSLLHYAFFVAFFPRLVAGPILRYREIGPQLPRTGRRRLDPTDLAVGLTMLFIGLAKKSFLADGIAAYASPAFTAAAAGQPVDFLFAWSGALAYTLQLYFDFSGYSDMAIGLARCFGIHFPMNFFSPYKAVNIVDFWRRWHMTLSRFLRDYLYVPLGGNRRGKLRRYVNLMITMLLGGLWHGASWTFVLWGGLHGGYLIVNHAWLALGNRLPMLRRLMATRSGKVVAVALTFLAVVVGWVFFRAPNEMAAVTLLRGMAGRNGIALPEGLAFVFGSAGPWLTALGISFIEESGTAFVSVWLWIAALLALALFFPSTQELLADWQPALDFERIAAASGMPHRRSVLARWSPSPAWAMATGAVGFLGLISITRVSEFLYWQF